MPGLHPGTPQDRTGCPLRQRDLALLFYQCGRVDYAFGALPRAVRRVRFTFPDAATMEVATRDGGGSFGRSFLITPLPKGKGGTAVALDQAGTSLGSYPVERCS